MSTFIIILVALTLLAALDVWLVRRDGYGHRSPPRSHAPWDLDGLPSEPYRSRH